MQNAADKFRADVRPAYRSVSGNHMNEYDAQIARIVDLVGHDDDPDFDASRAKFFDYLSNELELRCDVTGVEDFEWEEFYVIGPGSRHTYESLKVHQPSYNDVFELVAIGNGAESPWMMFPYEDLVADARRKSDGKHFRLGLSEIEAVDKKSENYQLLHDYSVWFGNWR